MRTTMKMMKRTKMAMARWLLGLCGLLCAQALEAQNLDSLLRAVRDRDQAVRMEVIRLSQQVPPQVDSLREAMGLDPIGDYLRAVEEVYGAPCLWDPSLGVGDMARP